MRMRFEKTGEERSPSFSNNLHPGNLDIANHVRNTLDRQIRDEHAGHGQSPISCTIHGLSPPQFDARRGDEVLSLVRPVELVLDSDGFSSACASCILAAVSPPCTSLMRF